MRTTGAPSAVLRTPMANMGRCVLLHSRGLIAEITAGPAVLLKYDRLAILL